GSCASWDYLLSESNGAGTVGAFVASGGLPVSTYRTCGSLSRNRPTVATPQIVCRISATRLWLNCSPSPASSGTTLNTVERWLSLVSTRCQNARALSLSFTGSPSLPAC